LATAAGLIFSLAWLAGYGCSLRNSASSAPDLNVIKEPSDPTILPGYKNKDGRTLSVQGVTSGETTGVIIAIGQSNGLANYGTGAYNPSNGSKIDQLNIYDGAIYRAASPMLGAGGVGVNWGIEAADLLITAGWRQRIILASVAISSTPISDWLNTSPPGQHYHRLVALKQRLAAKGLTPNVVWITIGESDGVAGTSELNMTSRLTTHVADIRALWPSVKILLSKTSYYQGTTYSAVTNAQQSIIDSDALVWLGSTTDTYSGTTTYRAADNIHFKAGGNTAVATDFKNATIANAP
jgi:lysophospholipase L1-like esterase